ncbi:uncharacterized protein LDX57_004799 [Aspergillus melleus]|uniref:uncharacterized protein n=1 Tax=Aspergillus melleus TaxID=138277 RepID=UPI001E8E499A|nr:uncharacterized protein LDX57_004799 [Aspergillus melleus]KAH8427081.1 hypothetical protein LDX57_004799 [Aspergillus melleus]
MADLPKRLPIDYPEWQAAVEEHDLVGKTVHAAELASASKMTYAQFLLLRVLWKVHLRDQLSHLPSVLEPYLAQANELLSEFRSWAAYCRSIKNAKIPDGSFAIARHYQIKAANNRQHMRPDSFDTPVARQRATTRRHRGNLLDEFRTMGVDDTPSKNPTSASQMPTFEESDDDDSLVQEESETESEVPSAPVTPAAQVSDELHNLMYPPTKDEQIVNTALVVFLNALTIHFDVIKRCDWTLHRKAFLAHFEAAKFEARTDGYLDDGNENPWALIEVKPVTRRGLSRVHVSQNRHEIFITIAEYDSGYVSYLKTKPADDEPPSFMTMHQYGPWNTESAGDMRKLGPILLALTLYAEAEVKKADDRRRSSW